MSILRTKPLSQILPDVDTSSLKRVLGAWDLVAIGIGCIIGVGIFVLPGVEAATHAGPGIMLSFAIAAAACACAALCYAELAAMIPVAGSAYTYGYATLGELIAWIIGWDLILEYMVGASLVAIGWSAYLVNLLNQLGAPFGWSVPHTWSAAPWGANSGLLNLPAVLVVAVLTWLLVRGIKESARANLVMVIVKVVVIVGFIGLTAAYVNPQNWKPFMPFGFSGVVTAAAIVFLAYVGFDAVSTTAEEAINPQRDMPIGIMGSLIVSTLLYMAVAAIMTGIVPYQELGVADPVALVLNRLNMHWASALVSVGAITGITSVLLVLLLGQPRILFAMSRDGLLPAALSRVHPRFRTPYMTTIVTGSIVAVSAALTPINVVAELCSIGTLFAFMIVSAGVVILRHTRKDMHRPFKVPLFPVVPILGVALCGYLMASLPLMTWLRFGIWLAIGLAIYAGYSYRHSKLSAVSEGGAPSA
ncbi:MAG: amino acid permease [Thermoanaerobaculaceae bacterium]|jgi:APA family basic amino acid/polyamine antiporter|nr:amino acid permease [Thermoanaerobaculaceae bacterium]